MHNGGQEDGAGAPLIVTVWTEGIFNVQMFLMTLPEVIYEYTFS